MKNLYVINFQDWGKKSNKSLEKDKLHRADFSNLFYF